MSKSSYANKNVFIASGTSGIGHAIAVDLASRGANITIAGRNEVLGNKITAELRAASTAPDAHFEFLKYDATSIESTKELLKEAQAKFDERGGLDLLFLTTGGLSNGVREVTSEGHEKYLVLASYSRYILAAGLIPQLTARAGSIWSVLAAAQGAEFDLSNIELETGYGLTTVAGRDAAIQDILTAEFTRRYPAVWYNHVYPGFVRTDLAAKNDLNFFLKHILTLVAYFFGWAPKAYAEQLVATIDAGDKGSHYWHAKSKKVVPIAWTQDEGTAKKLVEKLETDTGVQL